ncbi:hypothetical protein V1264_023262 [Littorina saxatilis]|uniref:Chitin-binding type-2 domain-containing protein n=1 Tax=Littorina saxatilis TaxID=31220 RepID=A0AAN9B7F1_9CAEN
MSPSPQGPDPTPQAMSSMFLITLLQTVLSHPMRASYNGPVLGYHDRCLSTEEECLNAASAGHYPVCGDCTRFLKCDPLTLSAAFTDCPATLLYDATLGVCNYAYNVDCRYQAAATAPTSIQLFPTSNSASDTRRAPDPTETWFTNPAPQSSQTPPPTETWFTNPAPKSSQTPPPTETWFTDPAPKSSQTPQPTALGTSKMEISSTSQVPSTRPAKVAAENPSFSQRLHVSRTSFGRRAQVTSPVPLASETLITGQTRIIGQTSTSNQAPIASEVPIISPIPTAGDTITDHNGESERLVTSQARLTHQPSPTATKTLTSRSTQQLYTENVRSTARVHPRSSITAVSASTGGLSRATESSTASTVQQEIAFNATSRSAAESSRTPTDAPWVRMGQKDGTHATGNLNTSISDGNMNTTESFLARNSRNKVTNTTLSFITDSSINGRATATTPTTIGRHLVTITTNSCITNTNSSSRASMSSTASSDQHRVDETTTSRNADGNKSNLMTGSSSTSATGRIQSQEKSTTIVPRSTTKSIPTPAGLRSPTVRQPERHQTTVKTRGKSTPANVKETATKKTLTTVKTSTTNTRPTTKETATTNTPTNVTAATTNTPTTVKETKTINTPKTIKETATTNTPRTIKGKATTNTPTTVKETATTSTPPVTATTTQSPACNTCVKDGFFGTCNVCSVYYLCRAGRIQGFMQCLEGLEWDDGLQTCTSVSSTCRRLKLTYLDDNASNGG